MDTKDFKTVVKSSSYCHQYPSLCWAIMATNDLGEEIANRKLLLIGLLAMICCGLGVVLFKVLLKLFPNAINRIIPRCARTEAPIHRLYKNSSFERLFSGVNRAVRRAAYEIKSIESFGKLWARDRRIPVRNRKTEVRESLANIGDGANDVEGVEHFKGNNEMAADNANGAVEIPIRPASSIGNRSNVDAEIAADICPGVNDANDANVNQAKPKPIETPKSPKANTAQGSPRKVALQQRSKSPAPNNHQVRFGSPKRNVSEKETGNNRTWKY